MKKMTDPAALLLNKLVTEYPERVSGLMHFIWAKKIFKECNISKLRVGVAATFYPYTFVDKYNRLQGYEIDLCEIMKQYFEVDIEYKKYNGLMSLFDSLKSNEVDIIVSSLGINEERKKLVNFTVPYFENYLGLAVNGKFKNIRNLHELNKPEAKIGVILGSTGEFPVLRNFYRANIIKCSGAGVLEQRLLEERIDAVINDANWINFLKRRHSSEVHIVENRIEGISNLTGIAAAKDNSILAAVISMFLMQYNDSPVRARNYQKWFGEAEAG